MRTRQGTEPSHNQRATYLLPQLLELVLAPHLNVVIVCDVHGEVLPADQRDLGYRWTVDLLDVRVQVKRQGLGRGGNCTRADAARRRRGAGDLFNVVKIWVVLLRVVLIEAQLLCFIVLGDCIELNVEYGKRCGS